MMDRHDLVGPGDCSPFPAISTTTNNDNTQSCIQILYALQNKPLPMSVGDGTVT